MKEIFSTTARPDPWSVWMHSKSDQTRDEQKRQSRKKKGCMLPYPQR